MSNKVPMKLHDILQILHANGCNRWTWDMIDTYLDSGVDKYKIRKSIIQDARYYGIEALEDLGPIEW